MGSMFVPEPVISLAVAPKDKNAQANFLRRCPSSVRKDPTFHVGVTRESGETIIKGMGELHLEVYIERMKREFKCEVDVGQPKVAYREAITQRTEFEYTHKTNRWFWSSLLKLLDILNLGMKQHLKNN